MFPLLFCDFSFLYFQSYSLLIVLCIFLVKDYAQELSGLLAESLLQSSDASSTDTLFSTESGVPPPVDASGSSRQVESETSSTLLEKASKFIKDGELDNVEGMSQLNLANVTN